MGESVELYRTPFFLNKIEGLGDVDANIQSQRAPGQDGSTYISTTLDDRYIPIEVVIHKDILTNRQVLSRVFNPKLGPGILVYENDISKREIRAVSEHVPKFTDERGGLPAQRVTIDLICHDPYWTTEDNVDQLVVWKGGLSFPLELPTYFAQQSQNKEKILLNEGDVETSVLVEFNGPATAPIKVINKTTGDFIEINQSLLSGEKLEVDTTFGKKRVTKILPDGSKVNVFHYINLESTFFQLIPGNNLLDYTTGGVSETAGVTITWRNRYLGL